MNRTDCKGVGKEISIIVSGGDEEYNKERKVCVIDSDRGVGGEETSLNWALIAGIKGWWHLP